MIKLEHVNKSYSTPAGTDVTPLRDVSAEIRDGEVIEDGKPEEIFENPKRERTRRFIRRLKVLEMDIESRDFDFPGAVSSVETYCQKNSDSQTDVQSA